MSVAVLEKTVKKFPKYMSAQSHTFSSTHLRWYKVYSTYTYIIMCECCKLFVDDFVG